MKPGDFLLGVTDFFAVLLPGALAMWLAAQYAPADLSRHLLPGGADADRIVDWTVFLLGSYVLGHFVFMIGSRLDRVYDVWRKRAHPSTSDAAYVAADELRRRLTPGLGHGGSALSTLKWARCYIQIHVPQARVEIDQIQANSKFFRSMVVMAPLLVAHFAHPWRPGLVVAALVMGVLSFVRFCDQRWKLTELSYATAVILYETKEAAEIRHDRGWLGGHDKKPDDP